LPRLAIACGLPGSGKSSFLRALGANPISSDAIRLLLADDETDQTIHPQVFGTMRYLARRRLALGRPLTYVDATHLTPGERAPWIAIARAFGAEAEALFFDTPAAVCKERNRGRSRVVPPEAIDIMAAKLVPPSFAEGFQRITVVK
jgi:predicted kinase